MRFWIFIALIGCTLAACSNVQDKVMQDPADQARQVSINTSTYDSTVWYQSATLTSGFSSYFLRSAKDKASARLKFHQVYAHILYSSAIANTNTWIFYSRANADDGTSLNVTRIDSNVDCDAYSSGVSCSYTEDVGVEIADALLQNKKNSGFTVRVAARNGSHPVVLAIPANYIQGHLLALGQ